MAISINVVGNFDDREIKRAQKQLDALRREAEKSGRAQMSTWEKTSASMKKYDREMTIAGAAVVAGLGLATKAASDLAESQAKSSTVFGTSAKQIDEWADTSAEAFLMSRQEALETAGTYGNLLTAMGLNQAKAADWSMTMTQLAADLASFNNTSVSDAVEALRAGLTGETEPLKRYGVALTDVRLKEEALAQGLIETTKGTLPPAIKMQAAYSLILKDTATAQGDVERTGEGLANQSRRMSAEFKNAQANLGEALLPAMTAVTAGGGEMLELFNQLPDPVQATTAGVLAVSGAALILAPRIVATVEAMAALRAGMTATAATTTAAAAPLVILTAGLAAAGMSAASAQKDLDKLRDTEFDPANSQAYAASIDDVRGRIEDLDRGVENLGDVIELAGYGIQGTFSGSNPIREMDDALMQATAEAQGFATAVQQIALENGVAEEAVKSAALGVWDSEKAYVANKDALEAALDLQYTGTAVTQEAAQAQAVLNDATAEGADVVSAYRQELEAMDGGYVDVQEAQDNFQESLGSVTEAIKDNGRSLDGSTAKGRANREALRQLRDRTIDLAEATLRQTNDQGKANDKIARGRAELIKAATRMGLVGEEAERYADKLGLIPDKKATTFTIKAKSNIPGWLKDLLTDQDGVIPLVLKSKYVQQGLTAGGSLPAPAGRNAQGGMASGLRLLGEYGPELVQFDQPARVYTAEQTRAAMTATSGTVISISVDARGSIDPSAVEAAGKRGALAALEEVRFKQMQGVRR